MHYNSSFPTLISSVYPEYNWLLWKFQGTPIKGLKQEEWKQFMDIIAKALNIKELKDWYKIKTEVTQI